ncbi:MAG: DNA polymerase IV [Spirochaetaceae bacterium]
MNKLIFHVDMDAFYAAVEQGDNPEYRGKPVIIGARPGTRGVVSACSYEARRFGVRSAMPISEAYSRCPDGIYLPGRMERYQEVSRGIMKLFEAFTPSCRQISIDEAFLDMTGTERLFGPPLEAAKRVKKHVLENSGLVISIGAASNKFCAKLASDYDKPDGLWYVPPGGEEDFISRLELKDLWGIGEKMLDRLKELNIRDISSLKSYPLETLRGIFGKKTGEYLYRAARGIDPGILQDERKSHSVSNETTFERDVSDPEILRHALLELSHEVAFRLLENGETGATVFIKVRFSDFTTTTAQKSLAFPLSSAEQLFSAAQELLAKRRMGGEKVRLIGVGVSGVYPRSSGQQRELFGDANSKKGKVEQTVQDLRSKGSSIEKASLLEKHTKLHGPTLE